MTRHEVESEIPRFTGRGGARHPSRVPVKDENHQRDKSCSRSCITGAAATVGTHAITITGGTGANYVITDVAGTLTVTASTTTPPLVSVTKVADKRTRRIKSPKST